MRSSDWSSDVCSSDLRTYLMVYADPTQPDAYSRAQRRLLDLRGRLRRPVEIPYSHASMQTDEQRDFKKDDYLAAVRRAKEYIAAGDLMQVQVGQVISKPFRDAPLSLYQIGRAHVWTPVTNAHLVCRLLLEKKKKPN